MLSCENVRDLLPGLVTGEKASHDVREHLAMCDACRTERDRLAREIATVREDLAVLAPSPFLEDAVVEAAHETVGPERVRRPWPYVAAAFVAAAALFLVVLLPRLQEQSGGETPTPIPGEEGEEGDVAPEFVMDAARIHVPPSRGEVERARQENMRQWDLRSERAEADEKNYQTWPRNARTDLQETAAFLPPSEDVLHRWVHGDQLGRKGTRTHTVATLPSVEGVFYLGNGLLNEIGGTLHAGTTGEIILGDKLWQTTPGTMQGEITVASPDTGGARARVRVLVSTGYSGTLMLEAPLARALGLHQFEIPGRVDFRTPDGKEIPVHGWRARARVAIPELDFDRVIEVQIVRQRPWMVKRGKRARETGVLFRGVLPRSLVQARAFRFDPETGGYELGGDVKIIKPEERDGRPIRQLEIGEGAFRLLIGFEPPGPESVPRIPDVPLLGELFDVPHAGLIPRALDFGPSTLHVIDIERVALEGRWEPGAKVTLARVWRGMTAIPSAEAVIRTEVGENGRIAFPRIAGEQGSTLRMLVTKKDGTSKFHDVVVAPELGATPRLDLRVGADGTVRGPGWGVYLLEGRRLGAQAASAPSPKGFAALVKQLRRHAGQPGQRNELGNSQVELTLHVEPAAPWRLVQWTLQAAAHPEVRIITIHLGRTDAPQDALQRIDLPFDERLSPGPREDLVIVAVRLVRSEIGGALRIFHSSRGRGRGPWTWEELPAMLRSAHADRVREGAKLIAELKVPPPRLVTFAEALRALEAFREAGFEDIHLEGAPLR